MRGWTEQLKQINILGTLYSVKEATKKIDPKLEHYDGYCDNTLKLCVVDECSDADVIGKGDLKIHKRKVMRHEVIHAFLYESGLAENSEWAMNEEMVDWIAHQFPKLLKAFQDLDCL